MKLASLFIGDNLVFNSGFFNYILREIEDKISLPTTIKIMKKNDKDILFTLEELSKTHESVIIFAPEDSYPLISKILSTLAGDKLELKNGLLIPSMSIKQEENSYLLKLNNSLVNVLKVKEGEKLPQIFDDFIKESLHINIISESFSYKEIESFLKLYKLDFTISSISTHIHTIHLRDKKHISKDRVVSSLKEKFKEAIIIEGDIVEFVIERLREKEESVSFAESCTGGLLAYMFAQNSGVSFVYDGSFIAYSYGFKEEILGIDKEILQNYGSVSNECIEEMLKGVLNKTSCSYAISISGIAGPGGATKQKPLGTVYIGVQKRGCEPKIEKVQLKGDRSYIQFQSAMCAISSLILYDKTFFN